MSFTARFEKEKVYISVTVTGELTAELLRALATAVTQLIAQTGCTRILNDLRSALPVKSTVEIYNMPKIAREVGVAPWVKRALVIGDRKEEFRFLETMFINQGNTVKLFSNVDDAETWLAEIRNQEGNVGNEKQVEASTAGRK